VTISAAPKLKGYAALAALGLVAGVLSGQADVVALAVPFGLICAVGLALACHPTMSVHVTLDRARALAGEQVIVELAVESDAEVEADVALLLEPGLSPAGQQPRDVRLLPGRPAELHLAVDCKRWGLHRPGLVEVHAIDRAGLFFYTGLFERRCELRVYPRPEEVAALMRPRDTLALTGDLVSRAKGEGIEFADIRPFAPGDRIKRINWHVSARRGALHVNEHHPERNSEVVLFLDTFTDIEEASSSTLGRAVAATVALAERYLSRHDRVGLVSYGGTLNWLTPASSSHQLYRIVDSALDAQVFATGAWRDVTVLPRQMLPPRALILALSPLLDRRPIGALLDLRSRGFDVAIVELAVAPASTEASEAAQLASRLWRLRRRSLRGLCESTGALVVQWPSDAPLAAAIGQVNEWRRFAHRKLA
jgi:uncharacterized protein (DUF58 family)